jgi:hypothetical protein
MLNVQYSMLKLSNTPNAEVSDTTGDDQSSAAG